MCQVQYFRCLREVPRDPTYLRSFCVAGAIFSMPPRSSCVTRAQGSLVTPPLFFVAGANFFNASEKFPVTLQRVAVHIKPYVCRQCDFVTLKPFPHPSPHPKTPVPPQLYPKRVAVHIKPYVCRQCDFVTLKPFHHPSPHPKTPVPPSYTLKGGCTYKAICLSTM